MQFIRLRNTIVILINPQHQMRKNRISLINNSVSVTAVFGFIELCKRQKAIGSSGFRLKGEISEESVPLSIVPLWLRSNAKKGISRSNSRPCNLDRYASIGNVKHYAVLRIS